MGENAAEQLLPVTLDDEEPPLALVLPDGDPGADKARAAWHPRTVAAAVCLCAVAASITHRGGSGTWRPPYAGWRLQPSGVVDMGLLSAVHVTAYHAQRMVPRPSPHAVAACGAAALWAYAAALYLFNAGFAQWSEWHYDWQSFTLCTFAITFGLWAAVCVATTMATTIDDEKFWVCTAAAYIVMNDLDWIKDVGGAGVIELNNATGLVITGVAFVCAMGWVCALSPAVGADIAWVIVNAAQIAARIQCGFHVHHVEWPFYVVVLMRHRRTPRVAGALVGVMLQEIAGGSGYRMRC